MRTIRFARLRCPKDEAARAESLPVLDWRLPIILFDQRDMMAFRSRLFAKARNADMASITSPDFPGVRLIVCRNPDLAAECTRKREDLLAATEKDLARIKAAIERKRNPLRGTAQIALKVGEVLNTHKMKSISIWRSPSRLQLRPKDRRDRRRGSDRRHLRRAHQPR
jgi:hypothetical protein